MRLNNILSALFVTLKARAVLIYAASFFVEE